MDPTREASMNSTATAISDADVAATDSSETTGQRRNARCLLSVAEQSMLSRARAGDQRAYKEFYTTYQAQVRGHLYRLLGPDSDAEDLVQTVFTQAFGALDRFKGESAISTWLYRITANTTHNLLRKRFRVERIKQAFHAFNLSRGTDIRTTKIEARDEAQRVLHTLPPKLREVFVLYHYEGLTLNEISEILSSPISTIGDRLTRARQKLRETVAK